MEILRVEHLTKRYGQGEAQVSALDDVSFCVEQGEFVAIVGPSGSGKSTLLHLLGGVDRPTGGKVYVSDKDMYALDETALAIFRRRQIGRALMASPAIVLADEPTGNLDRANSREIIDLLKRLHDELHQTLIIITHDEGIALQADRILKIEDGHIVRDEVIRR